jgi:hypothetical protein
MTINDEIYSDLLKLKWRIAFLRLQARLLKLQFVVKAGFDSNQPRVPGGNADGGQWTDNGGGQPRRELGLGRGSHVRISREIAVHQARGRDRQKVILEGRRADFSIAPNPRAKRTASVHEIARLSKVKDYKTEIERVASETRVEANLIRAIMYMETTRGGHYGTVAELIGISNSILPMNINEHNPQGEFHESGIVHLGPTGALFLLTAIPVMVIVFLVELAIHGTARLFGFANGDEKRKPPITVALAPLLDAVFVGLLVGTWLSFDITDFSFSAFASNAAMISAVVVFCVELIVQHIARSVRRAQANARANRIEP